MTTGAAGFGNHSVGIPLELPVPPHAHWAAVTAAVSRVFGALASAATMGVADPDRRRPARYSYLERAEMSREMDHL